MKILLTGVSGFMGKNLKNHLLERDYNVYGINHYTVRAGNDIGVGNYDHAYCDLSSANETKKIIQSIEPDIIIHLAANSTPQLNEQEPSKIIDNNIKTTHNLLHYASNKCKFIFASSIVVYGTPSERCDEKTPFNPTNVYATTKVACEHLIKAHQKMNAIGCCTRFRFCSTVGPNLTHGVVYDFIKKLKSDNKYLTALGNGPGSIKPYLHIDDVIQAIDLALKDDLNGSYNVVPNDEISVSVVASAIMRTINICKRIKWLKHKNLIGDNPILMCTNNKLKAEGWEPKLPYSEYAIMQAVKDIENVTG